MAIEIEIGGVTYRGTTDYQIKEQSAAISSTSLKVLLEAHAVPLVLQVARVYIDSTLYFTGIIQSVSTPEYSTTYETQIFSIEVSSLESLLANRLVAKNFYYYSYDSWSDVIQYLFDNYIAEEGITLGAISSISASFDSKYSVKDKKLSDVLDEICAAIGNASWWISPNRKFYFRVSTDFSTATTPADLRQLRIVERAADIRTVQKITGASSGISATATNDTLKAIVAARTGGSGKIEIAESDSDIHSDTKAATAAAAMLDAYDESVKEVSCVCGDLVASARGNQWHLDETINGVTISGDFVVVERTISSRGPDAFDISVTLRNRNYWARYGYERRKAALIAKAAVDGLSDIASDDLLSAIEKKDELARWNIALARRSTLDAKADTYGISRTAYDAAFVALGTYLNAGAAWSSGTPAWFAGEVFTEATTIVGATYDATWAAVETAADALQDSIDAEIHRLASTVSPPAPSAQWSGAYLTEVPDNAAGTLFNSLAVSSFAYDACSGSYADGVLTVTATGDDPKIWINLAGSAAAGKMFIFKVKPISGTLADEIGFFYSFPAYDYIQTLQNLGVAALTKGEWNYRSVIVPTVYSSYDLVQIRLDILTGVGSYELEIFYIGTGAFDTKVLDESGNGNNPSNFAVLPGDYNGKKALLFNGINSCINITNPLSGSKSFTFAFSTYFGGAFNILKTLVMQNWGGSGSGFGVYREPLGEDGSFVCGLTYNGAGYALAAENLSGWKDVVFSYDGAGTASLFISGTLVSTRSDIPTEWVMPSGDLNFGSPWGSNFAWPYATEYIYAAKSILTASNAIWLYKNGKPAASITSVLAAQTATYTPGYLGIGKLAAANSSTFRLDSVNDSGTISLGDNTTAKLGDWMVNHDASNVATGVYYWDGIAWNATTEGKYINSGAQSDIMNLKTGGIEITGYTTIINCIVKNLWAQQATIAATGWVKSANYAESGGLPTAGFMLDAVNELIKAKGAKFVDGAFTGEFTGSNVKITASSFEMWSGSSNTSPSSGDTKVVISNGKINLYKCHDDGSWEPCATLSASTNGVDAWSSLSTLLQVPSITLASSGDKIIDLSVGAIHRPKYNKNISASATLNDLKAVFLQTESTSIEYSVSGVIRYWDDSLELYRQFYVERIKSDWNGSTSTVTAIGFNMTNDSFADLAISGTQLATWNLKYV